MSLNRTVGDLCDPGASLSDDAFSSENQRHVRSNTQTGSVWMKWDKMTSDFFASVKFTDLDVAESEQQGKAARVRPSRGQLSC